MPELVWLAILSAFWPTLVVVDALAFQTPKPERILLSFLAGGLISTISIGTLVVLQLQDTAVVTSSKSTTDPALNITIGALALLAAYVLARVRDLPLHRRKPAGKPKRSPFATRAIESGAPLAFVAGVLLNIVPGVFPIIALKNLAELDYSSAETVAVLVGFYVVTFAFVEIPIMSFVVAHEWTRARVDQFNRWLGANQRRVVIWALVIGGVYLIARGVFQLL
jgi:Sap, sulfolipid-1-addressing protein